MRDDTDDNLGTEKQKQVDSLRNVRLELKEATIRLKAFGDVKPDDIGRLKLDANASPTAKQITEYVHAATDARVGLATKELARKVHEQAATIERLTKDATDKQVALDSAKLESAVRQAAQLFNVIPTAHDDLLVMARAEGFAVNADGLVKNPAGLDLQSWLEAKRSTSPHLWPKSRGAGARPDLNDRGLPPADNPARNPFAKGPSWNLTGQAQIMRTDPTRAERLRKLASG